MRGRKGGNYEVGYGKPPRQTRFKQGQSGNVQGRPRGSKNLSTLLTKALDETVTISENGKRRNISMREAIVKRAVTKAASGEFRAIRMLLLDQIPRLENSQAATIEPTPLSPAIGNLFQGAFDIIAEHGAIPPNMLRAIGMAHAVVPLKKEAAPTILPDSGGNANGAQAKEPQEDPPF
jgi:hypothetical protein